MPDERQANARLQAVRALQAILGNGRTLDQALDATTAPLVRELVCGTLRRYFSLQQRLDDLLTRPLRAKDLDVRCVLLIGAYQRLHTRIPDHAAVAESVNCALSLKKPWARGLVNAVLRNLPEPTEEWDPAALLDHPHWFINHTRNSLPEHWQNVLDANNQRAPMTLRVNLARNSAADYQAALRAANIGFSTGAAPETLTLDRPRPQARLPGYAEGLFAVQDAGAQFAAPLLEAALPRSAQVLDACAAPGGKGFHLLERRPDVRLTAQDISATRLDTLRQEAARLGHDCAIVEADSSAAGVALRYQAVLLDAPCSGSGTVRRHPDIKVLRREADIAAAAALQARLLRALWSQLQPGGHLLYCTLFIVCAGK